MKPPHKKYPIQDEFNEDNFVVDEEPAPVQRLPPPRLVSGNDETESIMYE